MKRITSLVVFLLLSFTSCAAAQDYKFDVNAESAILIDAESGQVLYEKNPDEKLPPASITKVMTMLLIMEAVDSGRISLDDKVTASAYASKIGGSEIWLKEKEVMTAEELIRAIAIVSANDACVAMAEFIAGSEESFVDAMNERARKLGMKNTLFKNTNGLPAENHYTTARDISIMSRELINRHPRILKWTSIWQSSLRGGKSVLNNTNKLLPVYRGADGLKTGHTEEAGFCLSATAKREGLRLISVVMRTESEDARVAQSARLLDYGFRTFRKQKLASPGKSLGKIKIVDGKKKEVDAVVNQPYNVLIKRGDERNVKLRLVSESIEAPVKKGQRIGRVIAVDAKGRQLSSAPVYAAEEVKKANIIVRLFRNLAEWIRGLFK